MAAVTPAMAAIYTGDSSSIDLADATNSVFAAKAPALLGRIADRYQLASLDTITKGASTAQSLATMGAGSSYAQGGYSFIVGAGAGFAANGVNQSLTQIIDKFADLGGDALPRFGIGAQVSGLVGMNLANLRTPRYLGPLELSRMSVIVNFMNASSSSLAAGLQTSATVIGLHAQYQVRKLGGPSYFKYGEVLFTTGFDYSRLAVRYDSALGPKAFTPITVGSGTSADPQLTWNPVGAIALSSGSGTIPIELSTNVRLLYVLSLYVGGGVDFNVGQATTDISLSGTVIGVNDATAANAGTQKTVGSGTVRASSAASPQLASGRGFGGIQINLVPGRSSNIAAIFVQASATSIGGFGVQTGLRVAW